MSAPSTEDQRHAARAMLGALDELDAVNAREPFAVDEHSALTDQDAWLAWWEDQAQPAYDARKVALTALRAALPAGVLAPTHPWTLRPFCVYLANGGDPATYPHQEAIRP